MDTPKVIPAKTEQHEVTVRSLIVLILTLVVVYTLFFGMQKQRGLARPVQAAAAQILPVQEQRPPTDIEQSTPTPEPTKQPEFSGKTPPAFTHIVSVQQLFAPETAPTHLEEGIRYLSGTHLWKGVMKSAALLGIDQDIKYVLKNNENTHFAFLGDELPDVADRLHQLGGKTIAITTENDIRAHGLFGDTVIFLVVPKYTGVKQLLFVEFKQTGQRRFLQVDDEIFEQAKPALAKLFTAWYTR